MPSGVRVNFGGGDFGDRLRRAAVENLRAQVESRLAAVRCGTHERSPTVAWPTLTGDIGKDLAGTISACCDDAAKRAKAAFGQ